jgi:type I restriction enzyme S subunit
MNKATNLVQTGIAWIPEIPSDWELKRIKLLFDFNKNIVGKKSAEYDVLSLTTKGVIKRDLESGMGKFPASFDGYQIVKPNSIMLCLFDMDVTPRVVGHVDDDGIISAAYTNIIPKKGINTKYYYYYFLLQDKNKSLLALGTGIRITLNKDFFGTLKIPVPPIEVQNSIVKYLDKKNSVIDKFIRNKERLIELLEEQKGINVDNHIYNTHCLKSPLKFFCKMITDGSHFSPNILTEGMNYVSVTDVGKNDDLDLDNCKKISEYDFKALERNGCRPIKNDILLTKDGTIGRAFLVKDRTDFVALSSLGIIRPNLRKVNPYLLRYLLISPNCVSQMFSKIQGSALTRLTIGLIKNLEISIPVDLNEQDAILKEIDEDFKMINLAISKAQKEISSIKEYREALITDLVTGKRSILQLQMS